MAGTAANTSEVLAQQSRAYLIQAWDLLQADTQQLLGLELAGHPRGAQVPVAAAALVQDDLLGNALCDVYLTPQAAHAHVSGIALDFHTAHAT